MATEEEKKEKDVEKKDEKAEDSWEVVVVAAVLKGGWGI